MSSQSINQTWTIGAHELAAVQKRLAQIAVALGHPRMASVYSAALNRERASLEEILASASGDAGQCLTTFKRPDHSQSTQRIGIGN